MKRIIFCALAVLCLSAAPAAADQGPYFAASLGIVSPLDQDLDWGEVSYEEAAHISGAIGYKWGNGLRHELEVGYSGVEGDRVTVDGVGSADLSDATANVLAMTINTFVDFKTSSPMKPYIGGGLGLARVSIDDFTVAGIEVEGDTSTDFTAFVEGGVSFEVTETLSIGPSYRFIWINDGSNGTEDTKAHLIKLGARFAF
jgi:opacity protein-like surface antigen